MLLLKTSRKTIGEVVRNAKHATDVRPNAQLGDLILIAQTKSTLRPGEKSVRYIMTFKGARLDVQGESKKIWGKKWKYVIDGSDVTEIPGFDLAQIQVSEKNYDPVVTHCRLESEDEEAVMKYLSRPKVSNFARSVAKPAEKSAREVLAELQQLDSKSADVQAYKSQRYFRDPRKSALLKDLYNHKCQICSIRITDVKGRPYAETHHITQRSEGGEDEISNMIVVCPNHHIMLKLGSARIDLVTKKVFVNAQAVGWTNKHL